MCSVLDDVTSNGDASNCMYLPPFEDPTVQSHVHVDENGINNDIKKIRLMDTVLARDCSNIYSSNRNENLNGDTNQNDKNSSIDLEQSPSRILAVLHKKESSPASCGVNSDVVARPISARDMSNAQLVTNSSAMMSPYYPAISRYAAVGTGIIAGCEVESLSASYDLRPREIINRTLISDIKLASAARTSERNGEESTDTRAVHGYPGGIVEQDIRPIAMLCSTCGQQEPRVPDSSVPGASAERKTEEKATECFILNRPTVDQFCATDKPGSRDMSVQTEDFGQFVVDRHIGVVEDASDMKVAVGQRSSPLMYAVPSTRICLPGFDHSGTPCETPCLQGDGDELIASDPKPQENDGVSGRTLHESSLLEDDGTPVIAGQALHESHCLQEDDAVHVSPDHTLHGSPCLQEEDGAQAIDKRTLRGSFDLHGDDGKTFVGDHSLHGSPVLQGEDCAKVFDDHTLHRSPGVPGEDSEPLVCNQGLNENLKSPIGDQTVYETSNPFLHESTNPLVGNQTVHESTSPLVGDQTVHESPKPLIGDQPVHESPKPLVGDQTVHESNKPLVGNQIVHESPKLLIGDQTVHESPKSLVCEQTVNESPKAQFGDETVCESRLQVAAGSQLGTDHTPQPPEETVISTPTTSPSSDDADNDNTESLSFVTRLRNRLRGTLKSIQS